MGRIGTSPILVEDCRIIPLKRLRELGFLEPNRFIKSNIHFSYNGERTASIDLESSTYPGDSYIRLIYIFTESKKEVDYKIPLVRVASNLGIGFRYYFVCPYTHKQCVKLYMPPHEHYFLHREAFPYLVYDKQTQSKYWRSWDNNLIALFFKWDDLQREIEERPKYTKLFYRGKPTPFLQKLIKMENRLVGVTKGDLQRALNEF